MEMLIFRPQNDSFSTILHVAMRCFGESEGNFISISFHNPVKANTFTDIARARGLLPPRGYTLERGVLNAFGVTAQQLEQLAGLLTEDMRWMDPPFREHFAQAFAQAKTEGAYIESSQEPRPVNLTR